MVKSEREWKRLDEKRDFQQKKSSTYESFHLPEITFHSKETGGHSK